MTGVAQAFVQACEVSAGVYGLVLAGSQWVPRVSAPMRSLLWWGVCVLILAAFLPLVPALAVLPLLGKGHGLLSFWVLGLLVRGGVLLRQFQSMRALRRASHPTGAARLEGMVGSLSARMGLRKAPHVLVSRGIAMPVLIGPGNPVLLVPPAACNPEAEPGLRLALAHELAHLQRRDLWLGLGPILAQTLLFFHPLVWLATREYAAAREEASDALARAVTGTDAHPYAQMLLHYVGAGRETSGTAPGSHYRSLLRRLNAMRIPYQQPQQGPLGALCCLIVLVSVGITGAQVASLTMPSDEATSPVSSPALRTASALPAARAVPAPTSQAKSLPAPNQVRPIVAAWAAAPIHPVRPRIATLPMSRKHSHARIVKQIAWVPAPAALPSGVVRTVDRAPETRVVSQLTLLSSGTRPFRVAMDMKSAAPAVDPILPMQEELDKVQQQLDAEDQAFEMAQEAETGDAAQQDQPEGMFSPQFRQQRKAQNDALQAQMQALRLQMQALRPLIQKQILAQLPQIRAEAEHARWEAMQRQQVLQAQDLARQTQAQALQAQSEALKQLKTQLPALRKQLREELPALQKQRHDLEQTLPPMPTCTLDDSE